MSARAELAKGWPLVVACGAGFGLGLSALPFYTYGVFVGPLRDAFGWSMATAQSGLTAIYLVTMVTIPATGWLTDRFGARALALPSLVLFSLCFMLLGALNGSSTQFLVLWTLISLTGAGTLAITWSRALSGCFDKARGLALGLALLGSGVTGFMGPPLARWLVDVVGWRAAYVCLGALPLGIALPIVAVHFREAPKMATTVEFVDGVTLRQALLHPRFWLMSIAFFMIGAGVTGLVPNMIKILTNAGMDVHYAVFASSLVGLFVIFGRTLCGLMLDLFWAPAVGFVFLVLPAVSCLLLSGGNDGWGAAAAAAALMGLATGAEFDLLPFLVGRYFGLAHFGAIMGAVSALFALGAALGAPTMGKIYDYVGNYSPGLIGVGSFFAASAILLLFLGAYPAFAVQPPRSRPSPA